MVYRCLRLVNLLKFIFNTFNYVGNSIKDIRNKIKLYFNLTWKKYFSRKKFFESPDKIRN